MNRNPEDYRKYCLDLIDAPEGYLWGGESPEGTDCSGSVCYPLIKMGYKIRLPANLLHDLLFTKDVNPLDRIDLHRVMAIFWKAEKPFKNLEGKTFPKGKIGHVTPVVGQEVILDADYDNDVIVLKTVRNLSDYMRRWNFEPVWREIDWKEAEKLSNSNKYYWAVDLRGH